MPRDFHKICSEDERRDAAIGRKRATHLNPLCVCYATFMSKCADYSTFQLTELHDYWSSAFRGIAGQIHCRDYLLGVKLLAEVCSEIILILAPQSLRIRAVGTTLGSLLHLFLLIFIDCRQASYAQIAARFNL